MRFPVQPLRSRPHAGFTRPRRGSILVALVVLLVVAQLIVIGISIAGARDLDLTTTRMENARSLYAAESAANIAMLEICTGSDQDGDGTVGSVASGSLSPGLTVNNAQCDATVSVSGSTYTVTATGNCLRATHAVQFTATTSSGATIPGLYTQLYNLNGVGPGSVGNIPWSSTPGWVGVLPYVNVPQLTDTPEWIGGPKDQFAMRFTGTLNVPTAGTWTFGLYSDDGSQLYINGQLVVNDDNDHSPTNASGSITLPAGAASFDLKYYENAVYSVVTASWQSPSGSSLSIIPWSSFSCSPTSTLPTVVGVNSVTLNGNGSLVYDGFDARSGVYGGSNIRTSGFSTQTNATAASSLLVQNAVLHGNAICGVGGTPSTAIVTQSGGSISGTKSAATSGIGVSLITVPAGMPSSYGDVTYSGTFTVNSNIHLGNASFTGGVCTISGNVIVEVDGNMSMSSTASIVVPSGSSLTMYVGGTFTMSNTSQLNVSSGDPRNVHIYLTGSSTAMTLNDSAQLCAYTFNWGGGLTINGGAIPAPAYSGIFHGSSVSLQSNARFHSDVSFGATTSGGTASTSLTQWTQIK